MRIESISVTSQLSLRNKERWYGVENRGSEARLLSSNPHFFASELYDVGQFISFFVLHFLTRIFPGLLFQACTEMVMPTCSDGVDDMFEPHSWNMKEYSDDCFKQWGVRPRPSWIPTMYGGKNISSHTNIIFR